MQAVHAVHLRAKHSSLLQRQDSLRLKGRTASASQWNSVFACILLAKVPYWQHSSGCCSSTATASHTSSKASSTLKERSVHSGSALKDIPASMPTPEPQCCSELEQQASPPIYLQQQASVKQNVNVVCIESQTTASQEQQTAQTAEKPQRQIALQAADAHRGELPQQQQQQQRKQPVPQEEQQQQQPSELVAPAAHIEHVEVADGSQLGYTPLVEQQQATAPYPGNPKQRQQGSWQQQQQGGWLQEQLQQATHWRQLLPLSTALRTLPDLIAVLKAALLLQPVAGCAAAWSSVGLAAEQQLFEQQHFQRYLVFLLKTAAELLVPHAPKSRAAAAGAGAAAGGGSPVVRTQAVSHADVMELLAALASMGSHMQQSLHQQLQQLPIHHVLQRQRRHWLSGQVLQVLVQLALLWPHTRTLPVPLQEQLCRDVLYHSTASTSKQHSQGDQQVQEAAADAAYLLWAAARLGWQLSGQHKQRAVTAVLGCLTSLSSSELAAALWGCAHLQISAAQLQHSWQVVTRPAASWFVYEERLTQVLGSNYKQQTAQQAAQLGQERILVQQQQRSGRTYMNAQQASNPAASSQQLPQQLLLLPQPQQQPPGISVVLGAVLRLHCSEFTARELVGVVWASEQLQALSQPSLLRELLGALLRPQVMLSLTDEDICSVLWALARMQQRRRGSIQLQTRRAQEQHAQLEKLQQQRDGQSMQGRESMTEAQQKQQQQQKRRQRAAAHASMLQQPVQVPEDLVLQLLQAYQINLPTCSSSNLARTLWSLSFIQVKPPRSWVVGVLKTLQPQLPSIDSKSSMLVALALARLKYLPDKDWLCSFWVASIPLMPSCQQQQQQQQEQSRDLKQRPGNTSDGGYPRAAFSEAELVILASSALELSKLTRPESRGPWSGQKPPVTWLNAITRASSGLLNTHTDLSTLLLWAEFMMRFSSLAGEHWPGPDAAWWQGFEAATEPHLQVAEPKELLRLLKALSTQQQHRPISSSWCAAFLSASRRVLLQQAASHLSACRYANGSSSSRLQPSAQEHKGATAEVVDGASEQAHAKNYKDTAAAKARRRPLLRPGKREEMASTAEAAGVSPGAALSLRNLANLAKGVVALQMLPDSSWMQAWEVALELRSSSMNRTVATALEHTRSELTRLAAVVGK